ncbi:MAG: NAD-dependent epimerase/dehydratase family protein [Oscillospiraceae bacterium]|jgi:dihydroflavonol-4-reductase|nr:NAD-dependent epimerase/dehydratase family protein [Oscillospiraceae bacterium]
MSGTSVITGATGHIGYPLLLELIARGQEPRLLLREENGLFSDLSCQTVRGDVTNYESLLSAFAGAETVYHLAGLIEIGDGNMDQVWRVNIDGTQNVIAACKACGVKRLVYCSSVDAMPPAPEGQVMREAVRFGTKGVEGAYGKSKAIATQAALNAAGEGFEVVCGFPSACVGPYDYKVSSVGVMIRMFLRFGMPITMNFGGYNFVDVRDVAFGLAQCGDAALAPSGSCYLLTGEFVSTGAFIRMLAELTGHTPPKLVLPKTVAEFSAPLAGTYYKLFSKTPLFTAYSLRKLQENGLFSYEKAADELAYSPRSARDSLADMIAWLKQNA